MNDLNKALGDIEAFASRWRATEFRGYGPVSLLPPGSWLWSPRGDRRFGCPIQPKHILVYVSIWVSTAVARLAFIGVQTVTRTRRIHSGLANAMIHMAVEQFLPSVGAGALLTFLLVRSVSFGSVDASRALANHIQPGSIRIVPFLAKTHGCSRCHGIFPPGSLRLHSDRARAFTLDDGRCLWNRAVSSCGDPIFHRGREPR